MAYQIKDLEITNQLVYDLFSCICEDSFLSVLDRAALGPALALSPSRNQCGVVTVINQDLHW